MAMQVQRNNTEVARRPVTFSVGELWLLHDFIRHEMPDANAWRYPPASRDLNEQIVFALEACETCNLDEYSLLLSKADVLAIDFFVRRDHKTPEGASGKSILLKTFRARKEMAMDMNIADIQDRSYKEVNVNASGNRDTSQDAG
jgi:hypothetical protein